MRGPLSMRRRTVLKAGVGAVAWAAPAVLRAEDPDPVRVFAAASLAFVLDEAVALWRRAAPKGVRPRVSVSAGASSTIARQIERGAPADLFISANAAWMDYAVGKNAVVAETRVDLLSNRLVLAAAPDQAGALASRPEIDGSIDLRGALGASGRLAIGRVRTVPLGIYGRAALEGLGLWRSVEDRLVEAENARLALAYVRRGETPLGVLYASDLAFDPSGAPASARPRAVGLLPQAAHPRILYPAALTPQGAARPAARDLLGFLTAEPAADLFRARGFRAADQRA